ncbi:MULTISPECIES: hypothetical protein [Roseobacteraceae]|nr:MULTISPECIES: hypothetical protein [unclassified Sulfitobacter]
MMYFGNITASDRVTLEGREVTHILPVQDKKSKAITHFQFSVVNDEGNVDLRKFETAEIPHLFDAEALLVEKGFHSIARQEERALYGATELFGATKKQRDAVDLIMQACILMERYRNLGMKLTRDGVEEFHTLMGNDYDTYQARKLYGTQKPNSSQRLKRLPSSDTLLRHFRTYKAADKNPNAFLAPRKVQIDAATQAHADFVYVLERLGAYADGTRPSKVKIITVLIEDLKQINAQREQMGVTTKFKILSQRTYERWIDQYLDPFLVVMQRDGLAAAQKQFGTSEGGRQASVPGEVVQTDAWQFHLVTLDATREELNNMTEEERAQVKRVRRWVVFLMDIATRIILGFSICRTPNENASLEALRMAYMDKTYLFREIGIKNSDWHHSCPIQEIVNDNGSEFGKQPFGGALFSHAAYLLSSTQMNTVAGVSNMRGHIERFFWTTDLKLARYLPGYTAQNPQARNDRKPNAEACIADDELHTILLAFVAEYHKTPHRGLNYRTPAAVWEELTQGAQYDCTQMPSPGQLREACGFYAKAKVGEEGIRYAGTVYTNERIRNDRKARVVDRIAAPGQTLEIKVDPFDLGGISVLADGELISVRCIDPSMSGKSLRVWQQERMLARQRIEAENLAQEGARKEAAAIWENLSKTVMRQCDIGMVGYSQAEVERAARELDFGKGQHEKPFIGRAEYRDPVDEGGFEVDHIQEEAEPDTPTGMDRFRSKAKARKNKTGKGPQ